MRDRMERFVVFPFSIGCVSHSSVDVIDDPRTPSRKSQSEPKSASPVGEGEKAKNPFGFLPSPPRPSLISAGIQRVIVKGFKGLTQLFSYKLEVEEEEEREMEIGLPTDVQHVGHIGWDGSNTSLVTNMKGWDLQRSIKEPPELISLPSISLRQFELAMDAQADDVDGHH